MQILADIKSQEQQQQMTMGPQDFPPHGGIGSLAQPRGQFVPYGKHVPQRQGMVYYTATGVQECEVCDHILQKGFIAGL